MKSKAILTVCFLLCTILLISCSGFIPNTGADNPVVIDDVENTMTPRPTETKRSQPSPVTKVATRTATPPKTPDCLTPTASVKISNVYLREGPDIRFPGSIRYRNGDKFTVLGSYRDWFHAEASDGNQGWLYNDWLSLPSDIDIDAICSVPSNQLPPTPPSGPPIPKTPENDNECEPTYYEPCD